MNAREAIKGLDISLLTAATRYADAQKILGDASLIEAVQFYRKKNPIGLLVKPLAEIIDEYIERRKKRTFSAEATRSTKCVLRAFEKSFQSDIRNVTGEYISSYLDSLKIAPLTWVGYKTKIHTFFNHCRKAGYLPKDWDEMEKVECPDVAAPEIQIYTPDEVAFLLNNLPDRIKVLVAIAAFAPIRICELMKLEWSDVRIGDGGKYIYLKAEITKTRRSRFIKIRENLMEWLQLLEPNKRTGRLWSFSESAYQHNMRVFALKNKQFTRKQNALRHSCISYMMAELQNAHAVCDEAGNSPNVMHKHYRRPVTKEEAARWFAVRPPAQSDKITYLKTA